MNVTLPDGTVINDVPDGMSKADLTAKLAANGYDVSKLTQPAQPAPQPESFMGGANALGSGFMRGMTRLVGLPVDTAANVLDLGKAGVGASYIALTGNAPPSWLDIGDRSNVTGSGENLIKNLSDTKLGAAVVNPANPAYEGGYIQTIGGGMAGALTPGQAALSAASAIFGKATYDNTGNPALAITAGMFPWAAQSAATESGKWLVRGNESGRQAMAQRIQDLKNAGVNSPTLGLASGNSMIGGVENLLQTTPGAIDVFKNARTNALNGLEDTVNNSAQLASPTRGPLSAGQAIQDDLNAFHSGRISPTYSRLNDIVEGIIGPDSRVPVANSLATAQRLSTPDAGAPATSQLLIQPRVSAIARALKSDNGGTPSQVLNSSVLDQNGAPYQVTVPSTPAAGIPFSTLKGLRTSIGQEAGSRAIAGTPEQAEFKQLYGGMSDDMRQAAMMSDVANGRIDVTSPTSATGALSRANDYYTAGMNRIDTLQPFANTKSPEQAYTNLMGTAKENNSILQAVTKSVSPETRGDIAGTMIDRLGRAKAGMQNGDGSVWSPETFLTNWNSITPKARTSLLSGFPNAKQVQDNIQSVADATSMMRSNSKYWANPSGTAANATAKTILGAIGVGIPGALAGLMNPLIPAGAAAAVTGAKLGALTLTSPNVVNSMASPSYIDPQMLNSQVNALIGSGLLNEGQQ